MAKYLHPFLPSSEIDWDKALIEAIPKVNAAKSPQEYTAAVNSLLAPLNDRYTRAAIPNPVKSSLTSTVIKSEAFRLADGVLTIDVAAIAETAATDQAAMQQILPKIMSSLPQAKAVVLDCRIKNVSTYISEDFANAFYRVLWGLVLQMTDKPISYGGQRYRMHNGYAPQIGTTSGGYYSALMQSTPRIRAG